MSNPFSIFNNMPERKEVALDKLQDELGICGCGNPDDTLMYIIDVLQLMEDYHNNLMTWEEYYEKQHALAKADNEGLSWLLWYWLDDKGLTEHGGNVSGCWLTTKGYEVLQMLNEWIDDLRAKGEVED
jgi:hypothetical protein